MQRDLSLYFDIPSLRRFFLFISLFLFISTSYAADDIGRLRYFILSGDQGTITHGTNVTEDSIKTQGASIHLVFANGMGCLLYTSPSPRDLSTSRMPSSA